MRRVLLGLILLASTLALAPAATASAPPDPCQTPPATLPDAKAAADAAEARQQAGLARLGMTNADRFANAAPLRIVTSPLDFPHEDGFVHDSVIWRRQSTGTLFEYNVEQFVNHVTLPCFDVPDDYSYGTVMYVDYLRTNGENGRWWANFQAENASLSLKGCSPADACTWQYPWGTDTKTKLNTTEAVFGGIAHKVSNESDFSLRSRNPKMHANILSSQGGSSIHRTADYEGCSKNTSTYHSGDTYTDYVGDCAGMGAI
jgi:opacity protein-like surface antigen